MKKLKRIRVFFHLEKKTDIIKG